MTDHTVHHKWTGHLDVDGLAAEVVVSVETETDRLVLTRTTTLLEDTLILALALIPFLS